MFSISYQHHSHRIDREAKTLEAMVAIFCRAHHNGTTDLCATCGDLYEYALLRLSKCYWGNKKPVCRKCTIHCYEQKYREHIKAIMQFSGPRMLLSHPVLTVFHIADAIRKTPKKN